MLICIFLYNTFLPEVDQFVIDTCLSSKVPFLAILNTNKGIVKDIFKLETLI